MSFLSVAFLMGLPLLAVPVAIHLFSRRRQEVVKWAAMQFLMDHNIRRRKIWRVDDLILMLLRTAAIAGVVLALSRPLWHRTGSLGGLGRDVIFVCDVSLSMERESDADRSAFERMLDKTKQLLSELGTKDTVRGIATIGRGKGLTPDASPASGDQKQLLIDGLSKIGVTQSSADWIACLSSALRVAAAQEAKARLVVAIGDEQSQGWRQNDPSAWQNLSRLAEESRIPAAVEFHSIGGLRPTVNNLAVDNLKSTRQLHGIGETILVDAEIRNYGSAAIPSVRARWKLNDRELGSSTVGPLPPGQSRQVSFKHAAVKAGIDRLTCLIDSKDDLNGDNERSVVIETIDSLPLLLVHDSTESDPLKTDKGYLLAALGHDPNGAKQSESSVFRVTTIAAADVNSEALSKYRAIIFANTPDLDDGAVSRISDFVRAGGGLWLALGDQTEVDAFNKKFHRGGTGLSPWPIEEPTGDLARRKNFLTVHPPEAGHPATTLLSDTQRLDVDRVKVFQRFPFTSKTLKAKVPVLLESNTGEPLAIEGFLGRGRIIIQSLPMGVRWSNLPLTQAYVPLVHEWIWYLVQPTGIIRNLSPGDLLQAALPSNEHVRDVELKRPSGPPVSLTPLAKGDQSIVQSRETQQPGSYEVVLKFEGKDDEQIPYQVNRPPEESNLDPWSPALLANWKNSTAFRLNPSSPLAMPTDARGQTLGQPLWATILAMVVLALMAEMWLSRRMAGKRFGESAVASSVRSSIDRIIGHPVGMEGQR